VLLGPVRTSTAEVAAGEVVHASNSQR